MLRSTRADRLADTQAICRKRSLTAATPVRHSLLASQRALRRTFPRRQNHLVLVLRGVDQNRRRDVDDIVAAGNCFPPSSIALQIGSEERQDSLRGLSKPSSGIRHVEAEVIKCKRLTDLLMVIVTLVHDVRPVPFPKGEPA